MTLHKAEAANYAPYEYSLFDYWQDKHRSAEAHLNSVTRKKSDWDRDIAYEKERIAGYEMTSASSITPSFNRKRKLAGSDPGQLRNVSQRPQ